MNKDALISAILIVKNEEQHLAACLDTIKDWVSEIIILDSGSTDDTLKIAERYQVRELSCHVLSRELCFYFQQEAGVIFVSISHELFQWRAAVS